MYSFLPIYLFDIVVSAGKLFVKQNIDTIFRKYIIVSVRNTDIVENSCFNWFVWTIREI